MVFGKLMFSAAELHAFMKQVQHDPFENNVSDSLLNYCFSSPYYILNISVARSSLIFKVPLFPVRKSSPDLLSIYGPVSDKELAERPEHIPRYLPAMHPEWCSDHVGGNTLLLRGNPSHALTHY